MAIFFPLDSDIFTGAIAQNLIVEGLTGNHYAIPQPPHITVLVERLRARPLCQEQ